MKTFDHILNWKLLSGSHGFPGPDGGTCINEAAIVAAGFEYREIRSASVCPPCFSRPIAQYAIGINDKMPDKLRQELLMPFVTRLAGTVDAPAIENERARYIAIQTVKRILPLILRGKFPALADQCAAVSTLTEARAAANAAANAAAAARKTIWLEAIAILDGAIQLGKQADDVDIGLVVKRMEVAKARELLTAGEKP